MKSKNSPVQPVKFNNRNLYIKRDDLLSREFSGNKARKFHYFLEQDYTNVEKIISYGSAQANSLYSLSVLAKQKGVKLDFYVHHISSYLKQNPVGNYKGALDYGANIIEIDVSDKHSFIENEVLPKESKAVFIEEGGRVQESSVGIKILAHEIKQWAKEQGFDELKVMLPSGTGTTALFLQKFLPYEVLTCACVGDEVYLKQQFFKLNSKEEEHPTILPRPKKYHFGKLYKEFYEVYEQLLKQTHIEFELLYDPVGFISLQEYLKTCDEKIIILYIHQGGVLGNESMIPRYERKFSQNFQK